MQFFDALKKVSDDYRREHNLAPILAPQHVDRCMICGAEIRDQVDAMESDDGQHLCGYGCYQTWLDMDDDEADSRMDEGFNEAKRRIENGHDS